MSKKYTAYTPPGIISGVYTDAFDPPLDPAILMPAGLPYLEGDYPPSEYYIADGEAVLRPTLSPTLSSDECIADGIATITVSNVPIGVTFSIADMTFITEAAAFDLTFDYPGTYVLAADSFPYKPFEVFLYAY
jgi:hypothetical protein